MPGEDYHTSTVSGAAAHAAHFAGHDFPDYPSRAECEEGELQESVDAALKDHFRETCTVEEMIDLYFEVTTYDERTTMFNDELEERLGRE